MLPLLHPHERQRHDPAAPEQAYPEIVVFGRGVLVRISPFGENVVAAERDLPPAADDVVEVEEKDHHLVRLVPAPRVQVRAVRVDEVVCAGDEHDVRPLVEDGHLSGQTARQHDVVAVQAGDVAGARLRQSAIECAGDAFVPRCSDDGDSRIALRPRGEDRRSAIGRPVVDDEQLEVGEVLPEDAADRLFDVALPVENGHQHRDARAHGTIRRHCLTDHGWAPGRTESTVRTTSGHFTGS